MSIERRYALIGHTHLLSDLGGGLVRIGTGSPTIRLIESDASNNNQVWDINADGEDLKFRLVSSDLASATDFIVVNRTNNTADAIQLIANVITMTGYLAIPSSIAAPGAITARAVIYVDSADGQMKVRMPDGSIKYMSPWTMVLKTADETRTNTTTLADDSSLKMSMAANTKYVFRTQIFFNAAATPDLKWRHSGPASPTSISITRRQIIAGGTSIGTIAEDTAYSALDIAVAASGGVGIIWIEGVIANGANAGDFVFRWAQNTSDAAATTILAGSWLEYMKVV